MKTTEYLSIIGWMCIAPHIPKTLALAFGILFFTGAIICFMVSIISEGD